MIQPWTLPLARRNPVHLTRRDLTLGAGDTLVLRLTLVERDSPDAASVDLAGFGVLVWMQVWGDFGPGYCSDYGLMVANSRLLTVVDGTVTDSIAGQVSIALSPFALRAYGHRLGYSVQINRDGEVTTVAWGALHIARGAAIQRDVGAILTDDVLDPVTTDDDAEIEV